MYSVSINSIRIPYSFQCENCGKHHTRTCVKAGATEVGLSPEGAQKKALESVNKKVVKLRNAADRSDFSWISADSCPDCGFTQSWQKKAERSATRNLTLGFILLLVLDLACISGVLTGTPTTLAWILAGLFLVCTGFFLRTLLLRKRRIGQSARANQSLQPEVQWPNLV
jgi:predicted RNA-binding Zn-ribbon protein involved in translation (DUF1610 family)